MTENGPKSRISATAARVFSAFLEQLASDKTIDPDLVPRLRRTLLEKGELDAVAIEEAVFPKGKNP